MEEVDIIVAVAGAEGLVLGAVVVAIVDRCATRTSGPRANKIKQGGLAGRTVEGQAKRHGSQVSLR